MKILTLTYKHTNCYLLEANCGWVMVDAGWPETLHQLQHLLQQNNVQTRDIKYLIVTHFHPDHAGLAQDFKGLGATLILHESQVPYVQKLNEFFKRNPKVNYKDIETNSNMVLSSTKSRNFLNALGIDGEIVHTPGHSDDSISLILDECCAFTGDLPSLSLIETYNDQTINNSWELILNYNVKTIFPAHGKSYPINPN